MDCHKFGVGYQLNDNWMGVQFQDSTGIVLQTDGHNLQHIEKNGSEKFYTFDSQPNNLLDKSTMLKYWRNYFKKHSEPNKKADSQADAGANEKLIKPDNSFNENAVIEMDGLKVGEKSKITRLPYLKSFYDFSIACVLELSDSIIQIDFNDSTKLIFCSKMNSVTYVDDKLDPQTFSFELVEQLGCSEILEVKLQLALEFINLILEQEYKQAEPTAISLSKPEDPNRNPTNKEIRDFLIFFGYIIAFVIVLFVCLVSNSFLNSVRGFANTAIILVSGRFLGFFGVYLTVTTSILTMARRTPSILRYLKNLLLSQFSY